MSTDVSSYTVKLRGQSKISATDAALRSYFAQNMKSRLVVNEAAKANHLEDESI